MPENTAFVQVLVNAKSIIDRYERKFDIDGNAQKKLRGRFQTLEQNVANISKYPLVSKRNTYANTTAIKIKYTT